MGEQIDGFVLCPCPGLPSSEARPNGADYYICSPKLVGPEAVTGPLRTQSRAGELQNFIVGPGAEGPLDEISCSGILASLLERSLGAPNDRENVAVGVDKLATN